MHTEKVIGGTSLDAMIAEMERLSAGRKNDEGHTIHELCEAMGVSYPTMLKRLHALNRAQMLKVGQRRVVKLNGRRDVVPVYQLVKPVKAKKAMNAPATVPRQAMIPCGTSDPTSKSGATCSPAIDAATRPAISITLMPTAIATLDPIPRNARRVKPPISTIVSTGTGNGTRTDR